MAARGETSARSVQVYPMRTELLHESRRTRVTRLVFPDGTLIRKEPLGSDGEVRRGRELAALEHLDGVEGVGQRVPKQLSRGSMLLQDIRGEQLAAVDKPLEVAWLTRLAVDLASVIAAVHGRGGHHRD